MSRKALYLISAILISSSALFAVEGNGTGNEGGIPITHNSKMALQEIQNRAWTVRSSADTVEESSPVLQPLFLNQIKDDIDYMQRQLTALQETESTLSPEEREVVAKQMPLLNRAEENADQALRYWNSNTDHLRGDDTYHGYLRSIQEDSNEVVHLLKPVLGEGRPHTLRKILTLGYGW